MTKHGEWVNDNVTRARTWVATNLLPGPSFQFGELLTETMPWVVGHIEPRWKRPDLALEPTNWAPEHRKCSDRTAGRERINAMQARRQLSSRPLGPRKGIGRRTPSNYGDRAFLERPPFQAARSGSFSHN